MEKEDWEKIKEKYNELRQDLEATQVVEYLIQDGIFHPSDKERVCYEVTRTDKATKLLSILKHKYGSYKPFYTALTKVQHFLAEMLRPPEDITPGTRTCFMCLN